MAEIITNTYVFDNIRCREFFDADIGYGGIEIFDEHDEHLGNMLGSELPDEDDQEEMDNFNEALEDWLIDNGY